MQVPPAGTPGDPKPPFTVPDAPAPSVSGNQPATYRPIELIRTYRLFDSRSVTIATLFASPIAGAILMALNYHRMGKGSVAAATVAIAAAVSGVAIALAQVVPEGRSPAVGLGLLFGTGLAAAIFQGAAVEEHKRQGGKLASRWLAFGMGVGVGLAMIVAAGFVLLVLGRLPQAPV